MRVAVISDVHGNLPALEAVLHEIERERVELIVSCGDVASGPMPAQTIDRLRGLRHARFVHGNADRGMVAAFDGAEKPRLAGPAADWCATQIYREQRDFLAAGEDTVRLEIGGLGRVLLCHGSPRNDLDVLTSRTPEGRVRELIAGAEADVIISGHTHLPYDRTVDGTRLINPGSVGMPYENPGAFWALIDGDVKLRRTDYDREAAAESIRRVAWPEADAFARNNVLAVPSEEEAMEFFRQVGGP
jgi:putative phosphoesterase